MCPHLFCIPGSSISSVTQHPKLCCCHCRRNPCCLACTLLPLLLLLLLRDVHHVVSQLITNI
jgi:hypothetical protein